MPDFDRARGHGFQATPDDDLPLLHPKTGLPITSKGVSLSAVGDIVVQFENDQVATIPSGVLAPSVRHDLRIKKLFATGTAAIDIFIWLE